MSLLVMHLDTYVFLGNVQGIAWRYLQLMGYYSLLITLKK